MRVRKLERVIEVSHWGNIAVEEHIHIEHVGAKLKGPFSRYDYQRDQRHERQPSVAGFKTLLPASARDVYYRDEIGNISTSALRSHDEAVEVVSRGRVSVVQFAKRRGHMMRNLTQLAEVAHRRRVTL